MSVPRGQKPSRGPGFFPFAHFLSQVLMDRAAVVGHDTRPGAEGRAVGRELSACEGLGAYWWSQKPLTLCVMQAHCQCILPACLPAKCACVYMRTCMQSPEAGGVSPNAYTYSALLKALGEHGQWQLAEALFDHLEHQVLEGGVLGGAAVSAWSMVRGAGGGGSDSNGIVQVEIQAARARLAVLAARAEELQRHQQEARAAQLEELQASSAAQLAELQQAMSQGARRRGGMDSTSSSGGGGSEGGWASGSSASSGPGISRSSSTEWDPEVTGPAQARPSSDGSVSSEASSAGSVISQASSAALSGVSSGSGSGSSRSTDSGRSWASPSQLNGLSLDLKLAPQPQPQRLPQQLNPPPPRMPGAGEPAQGHPLSAPPPLPLPLLQPSDFSLFSSQPLATAVAVPPSSSSSPAPPSLSAPLLQQQQQPPLPPPPYGPPRASSPASPALGAVLNEVVCGALMLAYERAGRWQDAVGVLQRARSLGLRPNTVMLNTAISAAGKVRPCWSDEGGTAQCVQMGWIGRKTGACLRPAAQEMCCRMGVRVYECVSSMWVGVHACVCVRSLHVFVCVRAVCVCVCVCVYECVYECVCVCVCEQCVYVCERARVLEGWVMLPAAPPVLPRDPLVPQQRVCMRVMSVS